MGYTYVNYCLSEIKIQLGILCFYLLTLPTLKAQKYLRKKKEQLYAKVCVQVLDPAESQRGLHFSSLGLRVHL